MVGFTAVLGSASGADIVALLTRPEFVEDFARELALEQHDTSVGRHDGIVEHDLRLTFSTARIPKPFNRIVPAHVTVDWHTTWTPVGGDAYSSLFAARAHTPRASCTGASTLQPEGANSTWNLTGEIAAERSGVIPARVIESGLGRLLISVLEDQVAVAQRWLAISA